MTSDTSTGGPLHGLRVVEFAGLGPAPFACMLLADMGADVVTIDRPGKRLGDPTNIVGRGRRTAVADLKDAADRDKVKTLLAGADVLVEGFRPGVMERLGLGPDDLHAGLIYSRMTGWGQTGPLAQQAGHDINYIALTGALHAIGPREGPPVPPLNLIGDYGGGSLYLVVGILAALLERQRSGKGQVVDAAITDGTLSLMTHFFASALRGTHTEQRGTNLLDGGAPFYGVYETADQRYVSVGPIEPPFFAILCEKLEIDIALRDAQSDRSRWPQLRRSMEQAFRRRTRNEWMVMLENTDACVTPVLALSEVSAHPHHIARGAFVEIEGLIQPAPAPRFSRTASSVRHGVPSATTELAAVCLEWAAPR
ncbi:MAG: CaiB/BaiF CoA-transferase family protein [Hydrogenophaga sp.]|uniref:CaiB/BaiF CoA transferase family protein n=1 Tax=Hydrogenophaga sp. TaxID=1904254 RepID=UPI00271BB1CD|nr:CaiB/BaiF CoA-transferase family protein [Hydrogenophaga sp.]MDO9570610.1 CaiB/BaiF CoA-transferase family protein [Hydrogenophaga sp.]MDP3376309.1 CaiB/BaiF CoA-transferase family protein [Hydrogenophaga sp.]